MEVANILDIDGSQWELQDVVARNKIATLETETEKLKTIEKWEYNIPIYGGKITARRQGNVVSVCGNGIGKVKKLTEDVGDINFAVLPERFRPLEEQFFMMRISGSYTTNYGGMIQENGNVNFYTYTFVDYGCFSVSYIVD